jgi:hypothetical protein
MSNIERRSEKNQKTKEVVRSQDPSTSRPEFRIRPKPRAECENAVEEPTFCRSSPITRLRAAAQRHSTCTYNDFVNSSRPNSSYDSRRTSLPSSTTSVNVALDSAPDAKTSDTSRRPSLLRRIKSSLSASGSSSHSIRRDSVQPSDFSLLPEQPERLFIDSIGMVIPGVCNRTQCEHPLAHFIANWRLCEPIEYTTALAEHGITYSDYSRLVVALANFLDGATNEVKKGIHPVVPRRGSRGIRIPDESPAMLSNTRRGENVVPKYNTVSQSAQQHRVAMHQAAALDKLLEDISWNWQRRDLPVMVCVSSYSLFAPNRVSEAFVQLLHVPSEASSSQESFAGPQAVVNRLSFIDAAAIVRSEQRNVAVARHQVNQRSASPPAASSHVPVHHHQQLYLRDRTKPWPLWPNAIPSSKREAMNEHVGRYGVDPYFRAWMRANINSRTRCSSYAKYMIEREDNPFINTHLDYVTSPRRRRCPKALLAAMLYGQDAHCSSAVNRAKYEHNRKLECRRTIEHGSRLRLASFGFRHSIYPPHTPEMEELGLTRGAYQTIISTIEKIRQNCRPNAKECLPHLLASWRKLRRRSTEDALGYVSEYIRQVNAADRRIVWTIEKIPCVFDRGLGRDRREWEISIWNGEDPLELLIQLERWGIIEKKLSIDDDD